jgi:hypothetical protein
VLIVDTEGLGDPNKEEETDLPIFILANLLSSIMIYNSKP